MALEYFCCYHSYRKKLAKLSDQEVGRLFRSLLEYSETGETQELTGRESVAFDFISDDIDRAKERYSEKCRINRENASERNRQKSDVSDRKRTLTSDSELSQNKDKDKDKTKNKNKDDTFSFAYAQEKAPPIAPPPGGAGRSLSRQEESFSRFWDAYPRKVGKQAALKAWKKLAPDNKLTEKILSAVAAQKHCQQWIKDGGQFIPNPTTWLNQGRWEDETEIDTPGTRRKSFSEIAAEMAKRMEGEHDD